MQSTCRRVPCHLKTLSNGLSVRFDLSNKLPAAAPLDSTSLPQVLKYEVGQFYKVHHDQNASCLNSNCRPLLPSLLYCARLQSPHHSAWGPRLYTFFMYLSDVEEGGECARGDRDRAASHSIRSPW